MKRRPVGVLTGMLILLASGVLVAGDWPSIFRGVVVTDHEVGVRVVSVEESSQAHQGDLRPEDVLVRVHDQQVTSIEGFAQLSQQLKGQITQTTVLVFRHGDPQELILHLYSYPVLRAWSVQFLPAHDVRFAQPTVGLEYWRRLGRGFEEADKPRGALEAYLNALHNVPTDVDVAMQVVTLSTRVSQTHLQDGELAEGVTTLRNAVLMMQRLFDYRLTDVQLETIKQQLEETVQSLKSLSSSQESKRAYPLVI